MFRMPKPENILKLNTEQLKVWESWLAEGKAVDEISQLILNAFGSGDASGAKHLFDRLNELVPTQCEHGRAIGGSCMACQEIEQILYPEDFEADGTPKEGKLASIYASHTDKTLN